EVLWRSVVLETPNRLVRFARGLALSTSSPSARAARGPVRKALDIFKRKEEGLVGGLGTLVKKLVVSSGEQKVVNLQHVAYLMPKLQCLHFIHTAPLRDAASEEPSPPIDARILKALSPLIARVTSLTIEDVDAPCWPDLCEILKTHGGSLRNLNIEAVSEIDAFESSTELSPVFPKLAQLIAVRGCRLLR
ncbi:hypothetical protein BDK51DRAFT_50688, partial [Blyttiomyces helicus]